MTTEGIQKHVTTITPDDLTGLRRSTPARTSVEKKAAPTKTFIEPPRTQTHITGADLNGIRAKTATLSEHDRLVKQSQKLVSQTFFGTLMKQMRESPFKS